MFMNSLRLVAMAAIVSVTATVASAATFNVADDFSATSNPNSPWSYGSYATPGAPGSFGLLTASSLNIFATPGFHGWDGGASHVIMKNNTGGALTTGTITIPDEAVLLHPSSSGNNAVVRFTAPTTDSYDLTGFFAGLDFVGPTTVNVSIIHNSPSGFLGTISIAIFSGNIASFDSPLPFSLTQSLSSGETLDFAVGFGGNNYFFDSTQLDLTISDQAAAVPLPPALPMMAAALVGIGWMRRRS